MHRITSLLLTVLLASCQTTSPKIEKKKLTNEQTIDQTAEYLKSKIAEGKTEEQFSLALIYSGSFEQDKRKLAEPILQELAKNGDVDATVLLAKLEFLGRFGYISEDLFTSKYQLIKDNEPTAIENYENEKSQVVNLLSSNFDKVKSIYDSNQHLCEQPLKAPITSLSNAADDYLHVKYFYDCIETYSVQNSGERLRVMAEYLELICANKNNDKICMSKGYEALSVGRLTNDNGFVVAAALRDIFKTHKVKLRTSSYGSNPYTSNQTTDTLLTAIELYNKDDFDKSSQTLIDYLTNHPDINAYDKAYVEKFVASILFSKANEEGYELGIVYANKALASKALSDKDHNELFDLVADVYFTNEQYTTYIATIGRYILDNQQSMDIIPANNFY